MGTIASQITSLTIVYPTVYSDANQRKHQSPASLAFVRGIHRGPVNSPNKWPVTRKMLSFDDVIMMCCCRHPGGTSRRHDQSSYDHCFILLSIGNVALAAGKSKLSYLCKLKLHKTVLYMKYSLALVAWLLRSITTRTLPERKHLCHNAYCFFMCYQSFSLDKSTRN